MYVTYLGFIAGFACVTDRQTDIQTLVSYSTLTPQRLLQSFFKLLLVLFFGSSFVRFWG
jgi:hypothetical protein